jgi:hypothetical protein
VKKKSDLSRGRAGRKHDWPALKQRFLAGEWLNFTLMSKGTGVPADVIRTRAAEEHWLDERMALEAEAEQLARGRILRNVTASLEKSIGRRFKASTLMMRKGVKAFREKDTPLTKLTKAEAIVAIARAAQIENEIFEFLAKLRGAQEGGSNPTDDPEKATQERDDLLGRLARLASGKNPKETGRKLEPGGGGGAELPVEILGTSEPAHASGKLEELAGDGGPRLREDKNRS